MKWKLFIDWNKAIQHFSVKTKWRRRNKQNHRNKKKHTHAIVTCKAREKDDMNKAHWMFTHNLYTFMSWTASRSVRLKYKYIILIEQLQTINRMNLRITKSAKKFNWKFYLNEIEIIRNQHRIRLDPNISVQMSRREKNEWHKCLDRISSETKTQKNVKLISEHPVSFSWSFGCHYWQWYKFDHLKCDAKHSGTDKDSDRDKDQVKHKRIV